MAREKRARQTKIYSVQFHGVRPFSLLYSYCKSHAIGTKLDVFGLYFSFDSFKYIDFNLKINLPLLLSEQTTVLGKVFELSRKIFFLFRYDSITNPLHLSSPVKMAWYKPHCVGVPVCHGQGEILCLWNGKKNVYIMNKKASLINQEFILLREVNTVM